MTTIYIPERPSLRPSLADSRPTFEDRSCYYTELPHLAVVVVRHELGIKYGEYAGVFDCSLGYHGADAPAGYTSAYGIGRKHRKITLRRHVDIPSDESILTWDEFLDGCPLVTDREQRHTMPDGVDHTVQIPHVAIDVIDELIHAHRLESFDALVYRLLEQAARDF